MGITVFFRFPDPLLLFRFLSLFRNDIEEVGVFWLARERRVPGNGL